MLVQWAVAFLDSTTNERRNHTTPTQREITRCRFLWEFARELKRHLSSPIKGFHFPPTKASAASKPKAKLVVAISGLPNGVLTKRCILVQR